MHIKKSELKKLKQQLDELKKFNMSMWITYGSELCVEDMISREKLLEKQIEESKNKNKNKK